MNPEVKEQWLNALRSGEYKQGRGRLRQTISTGDRFCCLGVLCDLAVKADVITPPALIDGEWFFAGGNTGLPPEVQRWADIHYTLPEVKVPNGYGGYSLHELAVENDEGVPFADIADMVEKGL